MSPLHSWLLVLALFPAAWVVMQGMIAADETVCRLCARVWRWWQAERLQQRQQDLARTRKARVRALVKRAGA